MIKLTALVSCWTLLLAFSHVTSKTMKKKDENFRENRILQHLRQTCMSQEMEKESKPEWREERPQE